MCAKPVNGITMIWQMQIGLKGSNSKINLIKKERHAYFIDKNPAYLDVKFKEMK